MGVGIKLLFVSLALLPLHGRANPKYDLMDNKVIDCKKAIEGVLSGLHQLRRSNENENEACLMNRDTPVNIYSGRARGARSGDCEGTYRSVRRYINSVDLNLDKGCALVNEGKALVPACRTSGQAACMKKPAEKFRQASLALDEAVEWLIKGQKRLKQRIELNREAAGQYANFLEQAANALEREMEARRRAGLPEGDYELREVDGLAQKVYGVGSAREILVASGMDFDPRKLRTTASDITGTFEKGGDGNGLDKYSREQFLAYKQGKTFLDQSAPLSEKLKGFTAHLNDNATRMIDNGDRLGPGKGSDISGGSPSTLKDFLGQSKLSDLKQPDGIETLAMLRGQGPGAAEREEDLDDAELFDRLDQQFPGGQRYSEKSKAAKLADEESVASSSAEPSSSFDKPSSEESKAKESRFEQVVSVNRVLVEGAEEEGARAPASKGSGRSGAYSGGKTAGDAASDDKSKAEKSTKEEALENYEASSNRPKKVPGRYGPSLRDMLREKLAATGSNSTTRAMHEVLGGLNELGENGEAGGLDSQGDREYIMGMDSLPLFARVRAAHLRYQRSEAN